MHMEGIGAQPWCGAKATRAELTRDESRCTCADCKRIMQDAKAQIARIPPRPKRRAP